MMTNSSDSTPNIGVFICHCGGNISDVVDVKRVAEETGKIPGVTMSTDYIFMCSDPGQQLIKEKIRSGEINRVVIAACSPRLHELTFRRALEAAGLNKFLLEQVNIREQASWVHKHDPEGATGKAIRLVRGAVEKIKAAKPLDMIEIKSLPAAIIAGGGIAGMTAALDLAERGSTVHLIEKGKELGGRILRPGKLYPSGRQGREVAEGLAKRVAENKRVNVYLSSEITEAKGGIGNFAVSVKLQDNSAKIIEAGVLIAATGFNDYVPYEGEYGYGKIRHVVTLPEFIEMLDSGAPITASGKKVRDIGFIHCVGSRQIEGVDTTNPERRLNAHCSRVCCTTVLYAVNRLKEQYPHIGTYNFYQDIRTYNRDRELEQYDKATKQGGLFFRYDPHKLPEVTEAAGGKISVKTADLLSSREEVEAQVDLLVLATGMVPADPGAIAGSFKLPLSSDRFLQEVHPKLRPVETAVGGIFLAGTAQAPFDTGETAAAAGAAAVKAAAILEGGNVQLEPFIAKVDRDKCKGHGDCVRSCPAKGAIYLDNEKKACVNPMLCISCGNCVAVCPERACDIQGYEIAGFERMVDEIVKE